jgi:hypothetical protein
MHLARAYKVAAWLEEAVNSLASSETKATLMDLATLGWETAARILWIRDRSLRPQPLMPANTLYFRGDEVKCPLCCSPVSLMKPGFTCNSCQQVVRADAELTAPGPGIISGTTRAVPFGTVQCGYLKCQRAVLPAGFGMPCTYSCANCLRSSIQVLITPKRELKEMIEETFGEEIRSYKVA